MSTLSARHGWTLRKDDALACTCQPTNPRHRYGWDCVPGREVGEWWQKHPECKGAIDKARIMCWLEKEFGR